MSTDMISHATAFCGVRRSVFVISCELCVVLLLDYTTVPIWIFDVESWKYIHVSITYECQSSHTIIDAHG